MITEHMTLGEARQLVGSPSPSPDKYDGHSMIRQTAMSRNEWDYGKQNYAPRYQARKSRESIAGRITY